MVAATSSALQYETCCSSDVQASSLHAHDPVFAQHGCPREHERDASKSAPFAYSPHTQLFGLSRTVSHRTGRHTHDPPFGQPLNAQHAPEAPEKLVESQLRVEDVRSVLEAPESLAAAASSNGETASHWHPRAP
jgi:hypothetical protein